VIGGLTIGALRTAITRIDRSCNQLGAFRKPRADCLQDLLEVVDNEQVALPGAFVHPSPWDPLRLELSMGERDIAVLIAMPDVDHRGDVLYAKAPVTGEEQSLALLPVDSSRRTVGSSR
jgi:hypothetical protein